MRLRSFRITLFTVQIATVLLLYVILPGHVRSTLTAFQPDSAVSLSIALNLPGVAPERAAAIRSAVAEHFHISPLQPLTDRAALVPTYKARLLLPALMNVAARWGPWWFVFVPSLLTYFLIGWLYGTFVDPTVFRSRVCATLLILPFLSTHVGWFLATVLTEGPSLLAILGILVLSRRPNTTTRFVGLIALGLLAMTSRQCWPVVAAAWWLAMPARNGVSLKSDFGRLMAFAGVAGLLAQLWSHICASWFPRTASGWSELAAIQQPVTAFTGVLRGIVHDLLHLFMFFDLPGAFCLAALAYALFYKSVALRVRVFLGLAMLYGVMVQGIVSVADRSYGQNFRFWIFATVLSVPTLASSIGVRHQIITETEHT